jgi:hypothetical protein
MTAMSDLDKGTTYGEADGPIIHVVTLGMDVPSFLNPREDLIPEHSKGKFKRLSYHVPFTMRGKFRVEDWPEQFAAHVDYRVDMGGYVLCNGTNREGIICGSQAVNRSQFCRNHGGALHPADKKMSGMSIAPIPQDRVNAIDRVQKFMQGLLEPSELDDDEVKGQFIRDNNGIPVACAKMGMKFQAMLNKELLVRMNNYIKSKAPRAIEVMYEVADSDVYEAADRIKAAQWLAERVIGKVPDVTLHGEINDTPFSNIITSLDSGSRSDYRKALEIESSRVREDEPGSGENVKEGNYLDAEIVLDEDDENDRENVNSEIFDNIVNEREDRKAEIKAAKDRIKKAKSRRYAARATGADALAATPILLQFKEAKADGGYRMKLIPGSTASPATIDKLIG